MVGFFIPTPRSDNASRQTSRVYTFRDEQFPFSIQPARIPRKPSARPYDTMAGNENRNRVESDGAADRLRRYAACSTLPCNALGQYPISRRFTIRNPQEERPDRLLKWSSDEVQRKREIRIPPGKIDVQPSLGIPQNGILFLNTICSFRRMRPVLKRNARQTDCVAGQSDFA